MTGRIKTLHKEKGFGFIRTADGTERFFHRSSMESSTRFDELREGDEVSFTEEESVKGPRAADVARV